jgi:hypothetical protein
MDAPAFMDAKRWTLLAVVVLAVVMRLVAGTVLQANLSRDDDSYRFIANQIATEGRFARELTGREPAVTAYRPPLYPLLLAGMELIDPSAKGGPRDWAVLALNVCLGGATAFLAASIAMKLVPSQQGVEWRAGLIAGILTACDPLLVYNATLAMTETLAAALAAAVLWAIAAWLQRPSAALAVVIGVLLGLGALTRPIFAPWLVLIVVLAWRRPISAAVRNTVTWHAVAIAATAMVVIAPWVIRNVIVMGRPIASTTHGGYTLLLGNNQNFYEHLRKNGWHAPWNDTAFQHAWRGRFRAKSVDAFLWNGPPSPVPADFDEIADDQFAKKLAYRSIGEEPARFAEACAYRAWQLWNPVPNRTSDSESPQRAAFRYLVGAWNVALYLMAIWGFIRIRRDQSETGRAWLLYVLALAIVLTVVHTFYWSNLRMRVPIVPALCVLAAIGVSSTMAAKSDTPQPAGA